MAGFSSIKNSEDIVYADNFSFDLTERGGRFTTDGDLLIGATASPHVRKGNLTAGAGITITNGPGTIEVAATGAGFPWTTITDATHQLEIENGYTGNRGTTITFTLPVLSSVGDIIKITNIGAGLPVLAQNAGQSVNFTSSTTTVGVGGSMTWINQFGSLDLVCTVANTTWNVLSSTGNYTIV